MYNNLFSLSTCRRFRIKKTKMDNIIYSNDRTIVISCSSDTEGAVVIESGVKGIRQNAFENCSKITEVIIPKGVERIGSNAFKGCTMLSKVILPEGLSFLGKSAFSECFNLKSIIIPSSLTEIKEKTFYHNVNLQQITIPEGVKAIGHNSFNWCRQLKEVILPSSLFSLGNAFVDCEALSQVTIKSEEIFHRLDTNKIFNGCDNLKKIHKIIDTYIDVYIYKDYEKCSKNLSDPSVIKPHAFTSKKPLPEYVILNLRIPENVSEIKHHAFYKCLQLGSVEIPGTVSEIPEYAFAGCTKLKKVIIHEGVKTISDYAFDGCSNLEQIKMPTSLKKISEKAFSECYKLTINS